MAIKRRKRGGHVYLEEYKTTREGGKVVSKFVRYIGREDAQSDSYKPRKKVIDRLDLSKSYRTGDVRLLWSIAEDLGFIQIIDGICCSDSGLEVASPQVEALQEANGIQRSEGFGQSFYPDPSYLLCASNISLGRHLSTTSKEMCPASLPTKIHYIFPRWS